jgi:hypothetical protein
MRKGMVVDRRTALVAGAGFAVAATLPPRATASSFPIREMLAVLSDPAGAARIGSAWLRTATVDAASVCGRLAADLGAVPGMDAATLRRRLASCIADDFGAGRVETVDGWILARTELRLAALATLALAA